MTTDQESLKQQAAHRAVESVKSGMVVGLGHGSTAIHAVRRIAELLKLGELRDILGIPCSRFMAIEADRMGIVLTTLEEHPSVDLTIDGADEVSPELDLIKGGGGALLHEKIVARCSRREIIIVDESKLSPSLGTRHVLPVEVLHFGWSLQAKFLESLGARVSVRPASREQGSPPLETDEGNLILDCDFGPIPDPPALASRLDEQTGILEHGLFLGLATEVIVASPAGIRQLAREGS